MNYMCQSQKRFILHSRGFLKSPADSMCQMCSCKCLHRDFSQCFNEDNHLNAQWNSAERLFNSRLPFKYIMDCGPQWTFSWWQRDHRGVCFSNSYRKWCTNKQLLSFTLLCAWLGSSNRDRRTVHVHTAEAFIFWNKQTVEMNTNKWTAVSWAVFMFWLNKANITYTHI